MRTQTFRFMAAMTMAASLTLAVAAGASAQTVNGAPMAPDDAAQMHDEAPAMDHGTMSDQDMAPATMTDQDMAPATMTDHDMAPADGAMMADGDAAMSPAHDPAMDTDGR